MNDFELGFSLLLTVANTASYLAVLSFSSILCKLGIIVVKGVLCDV